MGKLIGYLFCGAFAAAGIGFFAYSGLPMIGGWVSAKSWEPVQAELLSHELKRSRGDDSVTFNAKARYQYDYLGQRYVSEKVSFSNGSDNIGSYHQDMDSYLASIKQSREVLSVWVNPKDPSEAVIDREMRWGLLLFKSVFLFIFGGIGIGGLFLMYRYRNAGEVLADADPEKPWTHYSEWNTPTILSNAKLGRRVLLGFAIFWNLISWPFLLLIGEPISKGEYLALLVLLFPLIGCYLIWLWYKAHRSFRRTGLMPLRLDPYPASIGGQAGGVISISNRLSGLSSTAEVTIKSIRTFEAGSGDNRRTEERVIYEKTMVPSVVETGGGVEVRFCFDLEDNLSVSEAPMDLPRKSWRISFTATSRDGLKIERDYDDIPVFATSQASSIDDAQAYAAVSVATLDAKSQLLDSVLDLQPDERGHRLFFPAYRNTSMLFFIVIGLFTFGVGLAIPDIIFNIVFPLVGGILTLAGVYAFANSLEVRVGAEGITSKRSLFGYNFKPKFIPSYSFKSFKKKMSSRSTSGKKTTTYYKIVANGADGETVIVAEGLEGMQEADAAVEKLSSLLQSN